MCILNISNICRHMNQLNLANIETWPMEVRMKSEREENGTAVNEHRKERTISF